MFFLHYVQTFATDYPYLRMSDSSVEVFSATRTPGLHSLTWLAGATLIGYCIRGLQAAAA
jgi:hypothetical protein